MAAILSRGRDVGNMSAVYQNPKTLFNLTRAVVSAKIFPSNRAFPVGLQRTGSRHRRETLVVTSSGSLGAIVSAG
jgi:hypothetical protein